MIRIQRPGDIAVVMLSGVIERLATGEKKTFRNEAELLQLMRSWSEGPAPDVTESLVDNNPAGAG